MPSASSPGAPRRREVGASRQLGGSRPGIVRAAVFVVAVVGAANAAVSGPQCPDPLAALTSAKLEEAFDALIRAGVEASAATERVANLAISAAPIGARWVADGQCLEVQRVTVAGFYEGPSGHGDVEREAGDDRGGEIHRVASFQRRWSSEHEGRFAETWVDLTATVTIGESEPDGLDLNVSPSSLCAGDSAEALASVRCGGCPVAAEAVDFEAAGAATAEPESSVTDEAGEARSRLTAEEGEGEIRLAVRSGALSATKVVQRIDCCWIWDLDATFDYLNHDRYDTVHEQFRSRARFPGVALGHYVGLALCPTDPAGVLRRMRRTGSVVPETAREVEGSFDDAVFWFYEGEYRFDGTARGAPRWRLDVWVNDDEEQAACESGDGATAASVYLRFRMARDSVFVSWPEKAIVADGYRRFDLETLIDVDRLRACAPFSVEVGFDDPGSFERATLRLTPAAR